MQTMQTVIEACQLAGAGGHQATYAWKADRRGCSGSFEEVWLLWFLDKEILWSKIRIHADDLQSQWY